MKHFVIVLTIFSLISTISVADDAAFLTKGSPAPFEGFLITREKAEKIRNMDIDLSSCNKINLALTKQAEFADIRTERALKHMDELSKQITSKQSPLEKIGLVLLGAGVATAIAYGAARAVR